MDEWGEMLSTSSNELWLCVQVEAEDLEEDNGTVEEEFDGELGSTFPLRLEALCIQF